jgi:hypothetical protein
MCFENAMHKYGCENCLMDIMVCTGQITNFMHRKWITLEIVNCNMFYDFNVTVERDQCRAKDSESYECDVGLFNGKWAQVRMEHFQQSNERGSRYLGSCIWRVRKWVI